MYKKAFGERRVGRDREFFLVFNFLKLCMSRANLGFVVTMRRSYLKMTIAMIMPELFFYEPIFF